MWNMWKNKQCSKPPTRYSIALDGFDTFWCFDEIRPYEVTFCDYKHQPTGVGRCAHLLIDPEALRQASNTASETCRADDKRRNFSKYLGICKDTSSI
jgi:hypothetical protein